MNGVCVYSVSISLGTVISVLNAIYLSLSLFLGIGEIALQSLGPTAEAHVFDLRRPMCCVALEPRFGKRNTRQFVSGGMAGQLVLHEKGWLGQKDIVIHSGEGPIWTVKWRGTLIAWANDAVSRANVLVLTY